MVRVTEKIKGAQLWVVEPTGIEPQVQPELYNLGLNAVLPRGGSGW